MFISFVFMYNEELYNTIPYNRCYLRLDMIYVSFSANESTLIEISIKVRPYIYYTILQMYRIDVEIRGQSRRQCLVFWIEE